MSVYERPVIGSSDAGVLAKGSTFCLETPYYEPGWGGMMVEETGLVTQDGFELFTRIERNLRSDLMLDEQIEIVDENLDRTRCSQ